jgi:phytoene desaturase
MTHPIAIVGGGLGGLSAAIHLALAGRPVTIFEANPTVGGRANRLVLPGGFTFDTGPSLLNYPWLFRELFARAGRDFDDYVPLHPVEPALTFAWRDGTRFALSSDYDRLRAEVERLDPEGGAGLAEFFADAAVKYRLTFDKLVTRNEDNALRWLLGLSFREAGRLSLWRSLAGELGRFFREPKIVEALGCYAMYLGGSPYQLPGFFSILPYGELAHGLWLPAGGIYGLVQGLERLAKELGVDIETGVRVDEIETADDRVTGLRLADGRSIAAAVVVSNVDVPTTETRLVGTPRHQAARARRTAKTRMTPGVVTFYWGLRRRLPGLPHHTVFLPADYRAAFAQLDHRIPDDLPFYVSVASETDPSLAPPGGSTVFVLVPTPVLSKLGPHDEAALVADLRARVLARLAEAGAAFDPADLVAEEVWTPAEWSRRFGLHDGSAFGAAHTLFQVGPFRARNYSREIAGLYFTGAGTTPGTGMPMVVLSGQLTAERVLARESRGT